MATRDGCGKFAFTKHRSRFSYREISPRGGADLNTFKFFFVAVFSSTAVDGDFTVVIHNLFPSFSSALTRIKNIHTI
jgi:hypothetical protein